MASHELKIPLSYIHHYERTTVTIPNAIATAGSISADVNGKAVQVRCIMGDVLFNYFEM